MPAYTLLGSPGSPFVRKAVVALAEKEIPYEYEFVNLFPLPKGFESINPNRTLPVLRLEDGTHLGDSTAICSFLDRVHPERALYPTDPVELGTVMMWEEFGDTQLAINLTLRVFRPLVTAAFTGKQPDIARVQKTVDEQLPRLFTILTTQLGDSEFLVGDGLTIADIAVATHFVNLHFAGVSVDAGEYGALAAYVDRMLARPSFAKSIEREARVMPKPASL